MLVLPDTEQSIVVSPYSFYPLNEEVQAWFSQFAQGGESAIVVKPADIFNQIHIWYRLTEFTINNVYLQDRVDFPLVGFFPAFPNSRLHTVHEAQRDVLIGLISNLPFLVSRGIAVLSSHIAISYEELGDIVQVLDMHDDVTVVTRIDATRRFFRGQTILFSALVDLQTVSMMCQGVGIAEIKNLQRSSELSGRNGIY